MNQERWQDATHLLVGKVDGLYRQQIADRAEIRALRAQLTQVTAERDDLERSRDWEQAGKETAYRRNDRLKGQLAARTALLKCYWETYGTLPGMEDLLPEFAKET